MNDMTPDRNERKANLKGLGTSRKRVDLCCPHCHCLDGVKKG